MGRAETVNLSLGIRIKIKDLLEVIDEDNHEAIRDDFLNDDSLIDDENNFYFDTYKQIMGGYGEVSDDVDLNELNHEEYKEYITKKCKSYGDCGFNNYTAEKCEEYDPDNLYYQVLLVPFNKLVDAQRWGHGRDGTNGTNYDLDLTKLTELTKKIHDRMKELKIKKYTVTLNISLHSG